MYGWHKPNVPGISGLGMMCLGMSCLYTPRIMDQANWAKQSVWLQCLIVNSAKILTDSLFRLHPTILPEARHLVAEKVWLNRDIFMLNLC
jgi:hypothetical protein